MAEERVSPELFQGCFVGDWPIRCLGRGVLDGIIQLQGELGGVDEPLPQAGVEKRHGETDEAKGPSTLFTIHLFHMRQRPVSALCEPQSLLLRGISGIAINPRPIGFLALEGGWITDSVKHLLLGPGVALLLASTLGTRLLASNPRAALLSRFIFNCHSLVK
jgi:hypothetical protein